MDNAPNTVTREDVERAILSENYIVLPNGRTTVCQLTLIDNGNSGFTVEGQTASVTQENFNEELGKQYARERALDKVWMLLGYDLARRLERERAKAHESFEDRLMREYAELVKKVESLEAWIGTPSYYNLDPIEQEDQKEQLVMMRQYCHILDRRIARVRAAKPR